MRGLHEKISAQTPALFCSWGVLATPVLSPWRSAETTRDGAVRGTGVDEAPN